MKKTLIGLMFLLVSSATFADTLIVIRKSRVKDSFYSRSYDNMKQVELVSPKDLNEKEYMFWKNGIAYKIDGKTCWVTIAEVEFD